MQGICSPEVHAQAEIECKERKRPDEGREVYAKLVYARVGRYSEGKVVHLCAHCMSVAYIHAFKAPRSTTTPVSNAGAVEASDRCLPV